MAMLSRDVAECNASVYKLRQDPLLTIPDFRDDAVEHGIKLGGLSLHSARKLLDIETEPRAIDNGSSLEG